jgi:hypothetical protein
VAAALCFAMRCRIRQWAGFAVSAVMAGSVLAGCGQSLRVEGIGQPVDRIPEGAVAALLISSNEPPVSYTIADNQWLVFIDAAGNPVGHVHAPGLWGSRVIATPGGVGFADQSRFHHMTREGSWSIDHGDRGGMVRLARSEEDRSKSMLWLDGVRQGDGRIVDTGLRVDEDGMIGAVKLPHSLAAYGGCGEEMFAIREGDAIGAYELFRLDFGSPDVTFGEPLATWRTGQSDDAWRWRWWCGEYPREVGVFIDGDNDIWIDEGANTEEAGFGFFMIDLRTGSRRMVPVRDPQGRPLPFDETKLTSSGLYAADGGPQSALWVDGKLRYATQDSLLVEMSDPGLEPEVIGNFGSAVPVPGGQAIGGEVALGKRTGLSHFLKQRGTGDDVTWNRSGGWLVWFDPETGVTRTVLDAPKWLVDLATLGPFGVSDVIVLE